MVYLVEDDESIRELVIYTLKSQGFEAKGFERPSLFWKELEKEHPSLLLLDVMLPEEDGISILKKLRVRPDTRKLPIIMLTARGSEYDTVIGLDSGTVLSRTQLLNQIWGYEFDGESRTVDVHIRTLRQKLKSAGDLVETVRGVGYKIAAV